MIIKVAENRRIVTRRLGDKTRIKWEAKWDTNPNWICYKNIILKNSLIKTIAEAI